MVKDIIFLIQGRNLFDPKIYSVWIKKIKQHTQCSTCLNAFLTTSEIHADTISFSCDHLIESLNRFAKINKDSIHPNVKLYKLITVVEYLFNKHCRSSNFFDLILDDLISSETKFSFQCKEHANEAV